MALTGQSFHVSRRGLFGLTLVVLLPWAVVLWLALTPSGAARVANPTKKEPVAVSNQAERGRKGPWGELIWSRIVIEPPEDFIPTYYVTPQPIRWVFNDYSPVSLTGLWELAGLTARQKQLLDDPSRRTVSGKIVTITPPPELILDLKPEARAKLYSVLALSPDNVPQHDPFRVRKETLDDWFDDTALPDDVIALTRRLLYPRDASVLFSDHDLILPKLPAVGDRVRFIKTLSRKSTLLVHLQVPHGADVDALERYWGRGRRSKDVGPLLQSIAHQPQGGTIDIIHLLPPFARMLLYTYPVPSGKSSDEARDCHWTSLNFYNEQPDDRFTNLEFVQKVLLNDYYLVSGEPQFGDIILFVEPGGRGVHSCVYIADNIVFTKNGAAFSVPWLLGRLDSVQAFYTLSEPLEARCYRSRRQ